MDGYGRCMDNIFIQLCGASLKYRVVYLRRIDNGLTAYCGGYYDVFPTACAQRTFAAFPSSVPSTTLSPAT